MDLPLSLKNPPLDFELCELLGEKPEDFIIICADGMQVPFFGTPYDTSEARESWQKIIDGLNDRRGKRWREVFEGRIVEWFHHYKLPVGTTHETFRPQFSLRISRVCYGYSQHDYVAIRVFEKLGDRVRHWTTGRKTDGQFYAHVASNHGSYYEEGADLAAVIAMAVKRLLIDLRPAA